MFAIRFSFKQSFILASVVAYASLLAACVTPTDSSNNDPDNIPAVVMKDSAEFVILTEDAAFFQSAIAQVPGAEMNCKSTTLDPYAMSFLHTDHPETKQYSACRLHFAVPMEELKTQRFYAGGETAGLFHGFDTEGTVFSKQLAEALSGTYDGVQGPIWFTGYRVAPGELFIRCDRFKDSKDFYYCTIEIRGLANRARGNYVADTGLTTPVAYDQSISRKANSTLPFTIHAADRDRLAAFLSPVQSAAFQCEPAVAGGDLVTCTLTLQAPEKLNADEFFSLDNWGFDTDYFLAMIEDRYTRDAMARSFEAAFPEVRPEYAVSGWAHSSFATATDAPHYITVECSWLTTGSERRASCDISAYGRGIFTK